MAARVLFGHPSSLQHDTRGHPEQAARITAIEQEIAARGGIGFEWRRSPRATPEQLLAVHSAQHVEAIERLCAQGGGHIDFDTITSPGSWEAALHAAGGAAAMVDALVTADAQCAFSVHRPPGHHAEAERAMGFCLFNNVAVAASHALDAHGLERVLVLDWDVHHGNGTNDIFHASDAVLFASIHESPLYPGTGPASDVGSGAGVGHTVNLPVAHGAGDDRFVSLVRDVVAPIARSYRPQLLLVSAGFDAHHADPLAACELTEAGYGRMTAVLRALSGELGAPLGLVLEGGYHLGALAHSVAATLEALAGADAPPSGPVDPAATAAAERLATWWPALAG